MIASRLREPLAGRPAVSPLPRSARFPVVSVRRVAESLLLLHDLDGSAFGDSRAVNQPGLTVSVDDMLQALERVARAQAAARLRFQPDAAGPRALNQRERRGGTGCGSK